MTRVQTSYRCGLLSAICLVSCGSASGDSHYPDGDAERIHDVLERQQRSRNHALGLHRRGDLGDEHETDDEQWHHAPGDELARRLSADSLSGDHPLVPQQVSPFDMLSIPMRPPQQPVRIIALQQVLDQFSQPFMTGPQLS